MQEISKQELDKKLNEGLPTLPTVVTNILNTVMDEKSSIQDISKIAKVDQALVAKVLKIVNSAAYGLREKISTLEHALTIIGIDTIKKLFLSISVFDNLVMENQGEYLFNKTQFWCHSLSVATVAKNIALDIHYKNPDEAYVAGLLHDIGKILLEQIFNEQYTTYLKNLTSKPTLSPSFEKKFFSSNHCLLGKLAAKKWNLPPSLQSAIGHHHGEKNANFQLTPLVAIISVADFICWTQALGSFNLFSQPTLAPQMEEFVEIKKLAIEPILEEMNRELALNSKIFNFRITDLKDTRKALQRANLELGKINSLYEEAKKKLERHIQELNILNKITYQIRQPLDPSQIIDKVITEISANFGLNRIIWFSVDSRQKAMVPKKVFGEFQNIPFTSLGCKWDEEVCAPLVACMKTEQIVYLQKNASIPSASERLLHLLDSEAILLAPIRGGNAITDLLLIDNSKKIIMVTQDTLKVFEVLAVNIGMALENAKLFHQTAQMAIVDSLTNIYNRRQLDRSLENESLRSIRFKQTFSIALFDIDYFKMVNDNYGHQSGDIVLKDIAEIIKKSSRNIDIVGRFGGDEFLVILPNTPLQGALIFAERIRLIVNKYGAMRKKIFPQCKISLSIGLAEFDGSLDTPERILNKADKALYQSKHKGRNKVSYL